MPKVLTIMVEIYAKAEEVLIWMGLNNTPILESLHLEQLRYVEKLVVTTIVDLTDSSDLGDHTARYKTILVEPPESSVRIRGTLVAIFSHEWWTQIWVHQELAVSKKATVVVGVHTLRGACSCSSLRQDRNVWKDCSWCRLPNAPICPEECGEFWKLKATSSKHYFTRKIFQRLICGK